MSNRTATAVSLPPLRGKPDDVWFVRAEKAIMQDHSLEVRGLVPKIEMAAWDLGYEVVQGADPRYYKGQFELLKVLADRHGLLAKVEREFKDGLKSGSEVANKSASLRSRMLHVASELPKGDSTRKKLLAVLKEGGSLSGYAVGDRVQARNFGKGTVSEVWKKGGNVGISIDWDNGNFSHPVEGSAIAERLLQKIR